MRERVEDLGRICVMLESLLENELLCSNSSLVPRRPKDAEEWIESKTKEEQSELARAWAYNLEEIKAAIVEALSIACGDDDLNLQERKRFGFTPEI